MRSINVYDAACSSNLFVPLESLRDWKKLTDYKLIKADQEGTESSTDNGGDFFDLLHWFRRTRVDLSARERARIFLQILDYLFIFPPIFSLTNNSSWCVSIYFYICRYIIFCNLKLINIIHKLFLANGINRVIINNHGLLTITRTKDLYKDRHYNGSF